MRFKLVAGAAALALFATAAHAGTHIGWYVAADVGVHSPSKLHLTIDDVSIYSRDYDTDSGAEVPDGPALVPAGTRYNQTLKPGVASFVRGGYQFTPHWRVEAELGYRQSNIKHTLLDNGDNDSGASGSGHVNVATDMLNVIYDFAPDSKLDPFVGLGAGDARIKSSYRGQATFSGEDEDDVTATYKLNNRTSNGAWQILAGVSWALSDRLNLDVTYRYLDAGSMKYKVTANATYGVETECDDSDDCCLPDADCETVNFPEKVTNQRVRPATATTSDLVPVDETDIINGSTGRLSDQSVTLGLRWSFAPPAPPAPPVVEAAAPPSLPAPEAPPAPPVDTTAAPPPANPGPQSFIVYFAFDRSKLTDTALQVINAAAAYAKSQPSPNVMVTGHTDTAGSNAYNVALSMRRAQTVADGLVADGVDAGSIKTGWTGEKDLAVPTPNGTPNPENRRTTIDVAW